MPFQATSPGHLPPLPVTGRGSRRGCAGALLLAATLCGGCGERPTAAEPAVRQSWPVMGTTLQLSAWDADPERARAAVAAARGAVFRVDTLMSLWKPASDLSVVNRRAGTDSATVVDPETAEVLAAALAWAERSGGAFDPTVGPLVDVWGFYRERGSLPPAAARDSARGLVGWRRVAFDEEGPAVRLPERGMRLDLGAIAKGYAVDRAVAALRAAGVPTGMVDLGGNVRAYGIPPAGAAWRVGVRDPRHTEGVLGVLAMDSGAVATSGDYERFFVHEGVRYAHILDPRTGRPARGVAGVTVMAPTGVEADALSTALFLLGPEAGCALLAEVPGAAAVWVVDPDPTGSMAAPEIRPRHLVASPGAAERLTWTAEGSGEAVGGCGG